MGFSLIRDPKDFSFKNRALSLFYPYIIKFFLMRSPKLMRAGTGNKIFFIWPKELMNNKYFPLSLDTNWISSGPVKLAYTSHQPKCDIFTASSLDVSLKTSLTVSNSSLKSL